jgi:hypothetical protein
MRVTARPLSVPIMSAENSWSRNTVRPSFSDSWNQSRQVTRLPVQLWKYSWPTTASMPAKSMSVATRGLASTNLVLKMFRPLFSIAPMLKSPTATIMKRSRSSSRPKALLVPADRVLQRLHRVVGLVEVAVLDPHLQQHLAARLQRVFLFLADQARRHQREQVGRLLERVFPLGVVAAVGRSPCSIRLPFDSSTG